MSDLYDRDPLLQDFRNFVYVCWKVLGLSQDPTPLQYDIAQFLQHGPDRMVIEGFRGVAKSYLTAAYVTWRLYWDPDIKILCVSQSKGHADEISTFILQLIQTVPGLGFLSPAGRDRASKIAFDVGPALPAKQPSVKSVGVTGQMVGSRADVVVADDIETINNSATQGGRDKISELIKEFDAILKPGGRVVYLGTPQTEQSIYNELPGRGYTVRIWPAQYPNPRLRAVYGNRLAPYISDALDRDPSLEGQPTEPTRFNLLDLHARRASYGSAGYALQFMLDTSLADTERYPLKLRDLMIMSVNPDMAPEKVIWSTLDTQQVADVPLYGLGTDRFYEPIVPAGTGWTPYQGAIMFVDPAGTGTDETAYAIVKQANGILYCPECTGLAGGYSDSTMITLATRAKVNKVQRIIVEANFGDGMFEKLLQVHLARIYPCVVESVKVHTQKERRIVDTLEPVLGQHRLVIDRRVIENDAGRDAVLPIEHCARYRLFFQLTRITRDRGALLKDDRVDALAGAVAWWIDAMAKDIDKAVDSTRAGKLEDELKDFFKNTTNLAPSKSREKSWLDHNRRTGGR